MITDPLFAIISTIAVPFAMRAFVAWSVELRTRRRGPLAPNRAPPLKRRSDYPPPNDWLREFARLLLVTAIAVPVAWIGARLAPMLPGWLWLVLYFGSASASALWAFRRIRADDRRTLAMLTERLSEQANHRFRDT